MPLGHNELVACRVSEDEFWQCAGVLDATLRLRLTERFETRTVSVEDIVQVRAKADLISKLKPTKGFNKVVRQICTTPKRSLHEPGGSWFTLLVAGILTDLGEVIELESSPNAVEHDVYIPSRDLVVECKYFGRSGKETAAMRKWMTRGETPKPSTESGFAKKIGVIGTLPLPAGEIDEHGVSWITVDKTQLFHENLLLDKYRQLRDKAINLIAFNANEFGGIRPVFESLPRVLAPQWSKLSAFVLLSDLSIGRDREGVSRFRCHVRVFENPHAAEPVPPDLRQKLDGISIGY